MANKHIPALGYHRLTPLYDLVVRATTREVECKQTLLTLAGITDRDCILDLGCGTGTFAAMLFERQPEAAIFGIDADTAALRQARKKLNTTRVNLIQSSATRLPLADESFDHVFSSLMLHHLGRPAKLAALSEAYRVTKPGGSVHIADWGLPASALQRLAFLSVQILDGFATTRDNVRGVLPELLAEGQWRDIREAAVLKTKLGTLRIHTARK